MKNKHSSIITDIKAGFEKEVSYCPFYLHTRKGEKYITWEWEFLGLFKMGKESHIADQDMFACRWWSEGRLYTNNELQFDYDIYEYRNGKFIMLSSVLFITSDGREHRYYFHNDIECNKAYEYVHNIVISNKNLIDIHEVDKFIKKEFNAFIS